MEVKVSMSEESKTTRWDEGKDARKAIVDAKLVGKVMECIKQANANGDYPTTREVANMCQGLPADDKSLSTGFQDALLQGVLNPLAKQGKLKAKFWKQNQKIWAVVEAPAKAAPAVAAPVKA